MLLGTHTPRIDDKGRVVLPAKFRDVLSDGVVLTKGQDRCVVLWPAKEFAKYADRLNEASRANAAVRSYLRVLFSSAFDDKPDKQGRISVPVALRDSFRVVLTFFPDVRACGFHPGDRHTSPVPVWREGT
jgi:MraZ protein